MTTVDPDTLRVAAFVKASDDAIISHSLEGTIETWNPAAERMFGYTAAEAIGQGVELIVAPEQRDNERRITHELGQGNAVSNSAFTKLAAVRRDEDAFVHRDGPFFLAASGPIQP